MLPIAYGIKKKNMKRLQSDKPQASESSSAQEMKMNSSDAGSIADAILKKKKMACGGMFAEGGEVEQDAADEMEALSMSGDDFLSSDDDTELANQSMPEGYNEEDHPDLFDKRKKILSGIMSAIRMKQMGRA